jgi:hypothetical protein
MINEYAKIRKQAVKIYSKIHPKIRQERMKIPTQKRHNSQ